MTSGCSSSRAFQELVLGGADIGQLQAYVNEQADIPEFVRYHVQAGDTLASVAKTHQTSCGVIAKANRIDCLSSIGPGQILLVPDL